MILIVDDHWDGGRILCRLLTKRGYQCGHCPGAAEALAILASEPVRLAILDVMMPGMDGFDLAEAIRKMPDHADLPVVFFSANDDDDDRRRAAALGAAAYLVKGRTALPDVLAVVARHAAPGGEPAA